MLVRRWRETAYRSLDQPGVPAGKTLLVHGEGATVGLVAVQISLLRGAQVFATAGSADAERLRALDVKVSAYGNEMVDRVLKLADSPVESAPDTAPVNVSNAVVGALPALIQIVGGDPHRVLTIVDSAGAANLGMRISFDDNESTSLDEACRPKLDTDAATKLANKMRHTVLGKFAQLASGGNFAIAIAHTFPLEDWRTAMDISQRAARGAS